MFINLSSLLLTLCPERRIIDLVKPDPEVKEYKKHGTCVYVRAYVRVIWSVLSRSPLYYLGMRVLSYNGNIYIINPLRSKMTHSLLRF